MILHFALERESLPLLKMDVGSLFIKFNYLSAVGIATLPVAPIATIYASQAGL